MKVQGLCLVIAVGDFVTGSVQASVGVAYDFNVDKVEGILLVLLLRLLSLISGTFLSYYNFIIF